MDEVRVLVVADDPLARAGLGALLASQPGCTLAGQVVPAGDLAEEVAVYRPDVLLWDLGWDPEPDLLLDVAEADLPVVALLAEEALAAEAWQAGARGLLTREAGAEALVAALQAVVQGLAVIDPALAAALLPAREREAEALVEPLTPREEEVLQLLADGLANKAIALQLGISEHTVKFHVNAILGKLGAQSRTEAVVRATRLGLIIL
jgi:two-component system nitrate/nitrite response regulator NarL